MHLNDYLYSERVISKYIWAIDLNPYTAGGYFRTKHKDAKMFENHLKPVVLVFIR